LTKLRKPANILKKMIYLRDSADEYVYDLETEFGTFCAGVGELELKNTDSVFIKYKECKEEGKNLEGNERLRFTIQTSIKLEHAIATFLRKPHYLEYEKTFSPFILFSKKRYIGYLYEQDWTITPKLKYMGIVLKRRDNANIVKIIYGGIITRLLEDKTIDSAIVFLKEKLQELINGKFPMEDLTITKTLRGYYKNPDGIAHKVLADRIGERDPGNKPSSNDRIPYVYINVKEQKGVKLLQGEKIESPDFIRENNLKINYKFYITNQISKPVLQILELCLKDPEEPFRNVLNKLNREVMGCKDISSYFK
jgi:DNA polymerase elongation subunit (family B)